MRLLLVAGVVVCFAQEAEACKKLPFPAFRFANEVSFIGAASADTVSAGAGSVNFQSAGKPPSIFGQFVRVERMSATAPASVATLLRRGSLDVVLVPWTYGSDCTPMPWNGSARWITAPTRALFVGTLRDSSGWIGGRPTIDVHNPYAVPGVRGARAGSAAPTLTTDQMLDLYDVLPLASRAGKSTDAVSAAAAPLLQWEHDHLDLATRSPAREILSLVRSNIALAIIHEKRSDLAGTYRFVITLPTGDSTIFFARTEEYAMGALPSVTPHAVRKYSADGLPESVGYLVVAQAAASARELPTHYESSGDGLHNQGFFTIVDQPLLIAPDSTVIRGSVDLLGPVSYVMHSTRLSADLDRIEKEMDARLQAGTLSFAEGRFIAYPNGRVRYEARLSVAGGLSFEIHGERISKAVLRVSYTDVNQRLFDGHARDDSHRRGGAVAHLFSRAGDVSLDEAGGPSGVQDHARIRRSIASARG